MILPSQTQGLVEVIIATLLAVVLCVVLHYEALSRLTGVLKRIRMPARPRISTDGHGSLLANHPIELFDAIYYSAVCFTTLGLGDLVPVGAVRFMTGTEALTGFVLIAWSASFTFVEMERFWKQ